MIVPKMHKDFPKSDENWDLPTGRPLIVFADRTDAKAVRRILYQAFNREPDFMKRPGCLNSRLIPSKDFLSVGSDAARNRDCLIQKHQQVLLSVRLLCTTDIKHLDAPVTVNGSTHALREELLNVRYPLGSSMADTPERFFFAIDWADRGRNLEAGTCYLPVYSDQLQVATTFTRILPAYISDLLGHEVARKWFQPTAIANCQGVQLTKDDDGQWTGSWTTYEDRFDLEKTWAAEMSRLISLVQPCPAEQSLMNPSMQLQMTPQRTPLESKHSDALRLANRRPLRVVPMRRRHRGER